MIYYFLSSDTIDENSTRWFGRRPTFREAKMLLAEYCENVKTSMPDMGKPPTGMSLTFTDKTQCLDFFNRFLTNDLGVWIEKHQIKDALDLVKGLDYKLYMFQDESAPMVATALGAILTCDEILKVKLTLP